MILGKRRTEKYSKVLVGIIIISMIILITFVNKYN